MTNKHVDFNKKTNKNNDKLKENDDDCVRSGGRDEVVGGVAGGVAGCGMASSLRELNLRTEPRRSFERTPD